MAEPASSAPRLSVVVSTIGRPTDLRTFTEALVRSAAGHAVELLVVDQSDDRVCLADLERDPPEVPWRGGVSGRGVSLGRNVGARLATGEILTFPDDNCWYDPSTVSRALDLFDRSPGVGIVTGIQLTADRTPSMLRWQQEAGPVTRRNINHTAIESGTFYRRGVFEASGGFDEMIGVGCPSPYQAGEGSDLLVRCLDAGVRAHYDPTLIVFQDDQRAEPPSGFEAKMRGYGRGFGLLYRRHRLARRQLAYAVARKAVAAGVRAATGHRAQARSDWSWARGAVEGYRGRGLT